MFITNPAQFAPAPKRNIIPVGDVPGLMASDGSHAKLCARELLRSEYKAYQADLRDEDGNVTKRSSENNTEKYLAKVLCDNQGNLIWHDWKDLNDFLKHYPQSVVDRLSEAAVKANSADVEAVDRAEKNSSETQSD